ncbi:TlpA disulfide reductase family protein [Planctomycetaceae bacterium SH139]
MKSASEQQPNPSAIVDHPCPSATSGILFESIMLYRVFCLMLMITAIAVDPTVSIADDDHRKLIRVENGAKAPAIQVDCWSDGVDRTLEDLKGKTVVLHFWGTWCGPCIQTIPVWKQLEEKYRENNVVFLGVHTAGAKLENIRAFMKKHDWEHVTAIDKGESIPDSATFTTYGVPAVNQIVVIGPDGVVRYNGHKTTQTDGPVAIARELGVKGPGDEASPEEMREGGIAILLHMYGKEIEATLQPIEQK